MGRSTIIAIAESPVTVKHPPFINQGNETRNAAHCLPIFALCYIKLLFYFLQLFYLCRPRKRLWYNVNIYMVIVDWYIYVCTNQMLICSKINKNVV